jgi:hypothetical protein
VKHFRPELLEPPQNFYARELGILSRPNRRGWASSACPFHKSINHRGRKKSTPFAVRFDSGAFSCLDPTCIASGKANRKGDIVDFVRLRDGLSFKDAAQRLGAWDEAPSPETVRQQEAQDRDRKKRKLAEEMAEDERHHKLMDIRDDLHLFIRFQREACDRLNELNAGADPIIDNEADREWEILALAFSAERRAAFAYRMLSGLEVQHGGE